MKRSKGRKLSWIYRTIKVEHSVILGLFSLFFLVGYFARVFLPQAIGGGGAHRRAAEESIPEKRISETGESSPSPINFQVISWKPRAVYFPRFATPDQCRTIIRIANSSLEPSTVILRRGETTESNNGVRTSSGTFISASEDSTGTLNQIEEKIARSTMIPRDHGESFNILRYEIGQRYASHYDVFFGNEYGPEKSQRVASFLLYLSDVEEGGETMFPFENGLNMHIGYDYEECIGLTVKPHQGDGLLFYSLFPNGTIDETSLHGSCPVIKGEKWVATKWMRDQIIQDTEP